MKQSCFLGQVCGLVKFYQVSVHAAFRISAWVKYAMSSVRFSRVVLGALRIVKANPVINDPSRLETAGDFMQIDGLLLQGSPHSLNKDVVQITAPAIH